jgi:hypothetical protein
MTREPTTIVRSETARSASVRSATARLRAGEGIGPRVTELLADRLTATAAVARLAVARAPHEAIEPDALAALASVQRLDEEELIARWRHFRVFYASYLESMRARESTMKRALEALSSHAAARSPDPKLRSALRVCRLRRPPLAKVQALVAEARALQLDAGQNTITQTS